MAELNEVTEVAAEAVEEMGEGAAKVIRSLTQIKLAYTGIGIAVGAAVGAAVAFKIAYSRAETKYSEIADREISDIRSHYMKKDRAQVITAPPKPDLDTVVTELGYNNRYTPEEQNAIDIVVTEETVEVEEEEETDFDPVQAVRNIFEEAKEHPWDYAEEVKQRKHTVPYIIHLDEFNANELDYTQISLTYYEEDAVLADHKDNVIDDVEYVVGLDNLTKFGHGSGDPTVVYVRNEYLMQEMEINQSTGSYAEEVHGFKHSDESRHHRREWDG